MIIKKLSGGVENSKKKLSWTTKQDGNSSHGFSTIFEITYPRKQPKLIKMDIRYKAKNDLESNEKTIYPRYLKEVANHLIETEKISEIPPIEYLYSAYGKGAPTAKFMDILNEIESDELANTLEGLDWIGTVLVKTRLPNITTEDALWLSRTFRKSGWNAKNIDTTKLFYMSSAVIQKNVPLKAICLLNFIYNGEPKEETFKEFSERWGEAPADLSKSGAKKNSKGGQIFGSDVYSNKSKITTLNLHLLRDEDAINEVTVTNLKRLFYLGEPCKKLSSENYKITLNRIFTTSRAFNQNSHNANETYSELPSDASKLLKKFLNGMSVEEKRTIARNLKANKAITKYLWSYAFYSLPNDHFIQVIKYADRLDKISENDFVSFIESILTNETSVGEIPLATLFA